MINLSQGVNTFLAYHIKMVREWELLIMGERKEEEVVVPKNI